jgi:hypothetical protein
MQARLTEITGQLDQKLQRWELLLSRSESWSLLFKVEMRFVVSPKFHKINFKGVLAHHPDLPGHKLIIA